VPRLWHPGARGHVLLPALEQNRVSRPGNHRPARAARLLGRRGLTIKALVRRKASLGVRWAAPVVAAGLMGLLLGGCGNTRTAAPSVGAPALPAGFRTLNVPAARATLSVPRNWALVGTHNRQLLVVDTSGGAVIALWRYPVHGPAPQSTQQLQFARRRLIATARTRDPS